MADLDRNTITKLRKLLPMLASDHAGEVVATVAAIMRTLESAGACLHDLVALIDKPPRVVEKVVYREQEPAPKAETAVRQCLRPTSSRPDARCLTLLSFMTANGPLSRTWWLAPRLAVNNSP